MIMPLKKILSILSLFSFVAIIVVILFNLSGNSRTGEAADKEMIGRGMNHRVYDRSNQLAAEVTSGSSIRDFDKSRPPAQRERTLLKDIRGVIYKNEKVENDLTFSGRSGYVENEYQNFMLQDDARIISSDVSLKSDRFFMEGGTLISNRIPTEFELKNLKGVARNGIEYHMKIGAVNLLKASGTYFRDGKKYAFTCNKLMVLKQYDRVVFKGNVLLKSIDSTLKGREIIMRFTGGFKNLNRTDIRGKGYFYTRGEKKGEFREMTGKKIISEFDSEGHVSRIDLSGNAIVNINQGGSRLTSGSDLIYIRFDNKTKKLRSLKLMKKGKVRATGKRSFTVSSQRIRIFYNDAGDIDSCNTFGNTVFKMKEYSGKCETLVYSPPQNLIEMSGEKSVLERSGSRFVSPGFSVDTEKERLFSDKEIVSTVRLDSENPVFSKADLFVSSSNVEINEKTGEVIYSGNVNLFQGDTTIHAEKAGISDKREIKLTGKVKLKFVNGEKEISVSGEELKIDPEKSVLHVTGQCVLNEGENSLSGTSIAVEFNEKKEIEKISGEKNIEFKRRTISGKSDKLVWKFMEDVVTFTGNARLVKTGSGSSSGEEIVFFLKDEKVIITSEKGKRSETRID